MTVAFSILALVILTACLAVLHSVTRDSVAAGTLRIEYSGGSVDILLSSIESTHVCGTIVDGKGEKSLVDAEGILLVDLLDEAGVTALSQVIVCADDEYSATVTAQEIYDSNRIYLLLHDDEPPQLLVFGDSNSKRNVTSVVRLIVS